MRDRSESYLCTTMLSLFVFLSHPCTDYSIAVHWRSFGSWGSGRCLWRTPTRSGFDDVAVFAKHEVWLLKAEQVVNV